MPARSFLVHDALVAQVGEGLGHVDAAEPIALVEWELERRAAHVVHEDEKLLRVDACVLRLAPRKNSGFRARYWSREIARTDHDADGRSLAPPGAAEPLQRAGHRAGIGVSARKRERADIDPELQPEVERRNRGCRRGGFFSLSRRSVGR